MRNIFKFKIHGRKYHVEIKDIDGSIAEVEVNGTDYKVKMELDEETMAKTSSKPKAIQKTEKKASTPANTSLGAGETGEIKAPLPGSIFKILVKEGDTVSAGDTILVMEAMKMENNINSEYGGVVKSIKVSIGDNVMQDDLLMEIG